MTNQLATARSAYLQSAAHQPIHWQVWGPDAFAKARREDRPVLLDIGAVWCHWCHVMDGESYEDPELAAFLNEHFVCIKVDRDERPDVDARYQRAVQAITSQGGWPLTAFLTPEGKVFYGGTYFPPDGRYGRPGFRAVLEQVRTVYHGERERVERQAETLARVLAEHFEEIAAGDPTPAVLEEAIKRMASLFDYRHGGFGTQPKFPHPAAVTLLLGHWRDSGDDWAMEMAARTLAGMARGGIHDHLGGGFHRYSVDARWIVPHFEKMSYDNAGLLAAYLDGSAALGEEEFAATARGIVRWVREVLADPAGGYGASQDADVGLHDDGDYFTWTREEAEAAIGDSDAFAVAAAYYDIGTAGEMQHDPAKNVLHVPEPLAAIAARLGLDPGTALARLTLAQERMRVARAARQAPYVDPTRYTAWNGMLAGALVRAGIFLDDPWALEHALGTLGRIRAEHEDPTRLRHSPGGVTGLLDDQVQIALALLDAHEATGDAQWLDWAAALLDRVWVEYLDPAEGGLFDTAEAAGEGLLPTRVKPVQDAPTPSPNGVAVLAAARLAELTGESRWAERRDGLLRAFAGSAAQLGLHGATYLQGLDWSVRPATHLVIVEGEEADAVSRADALHRAALRAFFPRRVVQRLRHGDAERPGVPVPVRALLATSRQTRAIACQGAACQAPVHAPEEWQATLSRLTDIGH
jgi:uncharacterized protein YyaL (SSP411 family)